jgi:hypothetical protein
MREVELRGLEPDNLLAFLALLGLMRTLDSERPELQPKVTWRGLPMRPHLQLETEEQVDASQVATWVATGLERLGQEVDFSGHKNIDHTPAQFRQLCEAAEEERTRATSDWLAALGSEANANKDGTRIQATALCAVFGQGHQDFLSRVQTLAKETPPATKKAKRGQRAPPAPEAWWTERLEATLLRTWTNEDDATGWPVTLRWDPGENRQYAYRFANPSKSGESIMTMFGAYRLAVMALPWFPTAPTQRRLRTTAFMDAGGDMAVSWPLWTVPLGAAAVRALLRHPALVRASPDPAELRPYGVGEVMRARRVQVERYMSFLRARGLWGGTGAFGAPPST